MGTKERVRGLATALRLDSHHAIERFGVIFGCLAVTLALVFTSASASSMTNQVEALDSTTLYTPSFTTSKTQLAGDVTGVYVNSKRTRTLVMMQFDEASSVSSNAEDYEAFLTGANPDTTPQSLKSDVSGKIVVFGATGYMGMVLESATPFEQQILNLTMRANSELVYRPEQSRKIREDLQGQKSFTEFDQWRLFFNPGATGAEKAQSLDAETFDPGAVYAELIIRPQEDEARQKLEEQLSQMKADLTRIQSYENEASRVQVAGVSLALPQTLEQIAGDKITGTAATEGGESTLDLQTRWVSPRGYDFDWREGSVEQGYLDEMVPEDTTYVSWLGEKSASSKQGDDTMSFTNIEWTFSDGMLVKDAPSGDTLKPLLDLRNALAQAYKDYFSNKVKYQTDGHAALIELEIDLRNVRDAASINAGEKVLFTY